MYYYCSVSQEVSVLSLYALALQGCAPYCDFINSINYNSEYFLRVSLLQIKSELSSRTSVKLVSIMIKPGVEEILSNP